MIMYVQCVHNTASASSDAIEMPMADLQGQQDNKDWEIENSISMNNTSILPSDRGR